MAFIKIFLRSIFVFSALFLFTLERASSQAPSPEAARTIIHLLDYIGLDYSAAVEAGEVINEMEFEEMQEFSATVEELSQEIHFENENDSLFAFQQILQLKQGIQGKIEQKEIIEIAASIKKLIISATGIKVSPMDWPDLANGKTLYIQHCGPCHGETGDGEGVLAAGLDPEPTSFHDEKMKEISPFQAYNTIRLGVSGTSMPAFDVLSDEEAWDLAFYVKTFYYKDKQNDDLAAKVIADNSLNLEAIAFLSDIDLKEHLEGNETDKEEAIAAIRHYIHVAEPTNSLALAKQFVKEAAQLYEQGDKKAARSRALYAYLEGIEPVELQIRANNPKFVLALEGYMADLRSAIEQEKPVEEVLATANIALTGIEEANEILGNNDFSFWLSFLLSASVILREGLEAFLIIVTILSIIRAANAPKAAKWVHLGWIAAVALGVLGWFFTDSLISMSGASREILEGSIALFAAALLLYIGFWLHSKSEIGKWTAFVKERVHKLLHGGNMFGLALFSFFVVFREAFESVLFLSALNLEVETANKPAIGLGVLVAFVAVLILSWIFLKYTAKLPIIKLFKFSSIVIAALSVILVGKGVHAIQETGIFSITAFPVHFRIDFLGVYPTIETLLSQLVVLVLIVILYQIGIRTSTKDKTLAPAQQEAEK